MGVNTTTASERLSKRPKAVPPASKNDRVIEVVSLIGFLLNIGLIIYGLINLPENIPHIGLSGGIDSYGSKWIFLSVLFVSNVLIYTLLTVANRYPYILNYPVIVTEENAPGLYRLARSMIRWIKAIMVWMTAILAWELIVVLPYNPGQSVNSLLILVVFGIAMTIATGYYVIKILQVSMTQNRTTEKGY